MEDIPRDRFHWTAYQSTWKIFHETAFTGLQIRAMLCSRSRPFRLLCVNLVDNSIGSAVAHALAGLIRPAATENGTLISIRFV
ncbi:UNVERIFIED_CONTAM: hypothetical protein FKN15_063303 [Acipenser sinensis]